MLTEFGGIQFTEGEPAGDTWGYSRAADAEDFRGRVGALVEAVLASDFLAGFCYTQLTDTMQEANGLCDEHRVPKLPAADIARIVRGRRPVLTVAVTPSRTPTASHAAHRRPKARRAAYRRWSR